MTDAESQSAGVAEHAGDPARSAAPGLTGRAGQASATAAAAPPAAAGDLPQTQNPWEKYSWLLGVVWVVFMIFPFTSALTEGEASTPARTAAVVLLALFSAVYIAGYIAMVRSHDWRLATRIGGLSIAVMTVLMIAAALLVGPGALGAGSFLISIAMFTGPVRRALVLATSLLLGGYAALAIVLALTPNGFAEQGVLFLPPAIVFVSVAAVRLLMSAGDRHDAIERQRDLVAERERVARDVHDVLGHSLTIVTVKAELAERLIDIDPERAKAEIAQIRSLSREALAEVRATVSGLRVARLGDELASARSALEAAGIEADVPSDPALVDPRYRIIAAWVLREAVTNVVRHSGAGRCTVRLVPGGIAVDDDGIGIAADAAVRGLRGVRERVTAAGAALEIVPSREFAGGPATRPGTRIEVTW